MVITEEQKQFLEENDYVVIDNFISDKDCDAIKESIREWAAKIIQRQWDKCYYNPKYSICRKVVMEGYYKLFHNSKPENE